MLDTSVLVAAIRSPDGASRALIDAILEDRVELILSVPLALEYEAVVTRPEHLRISGYTAIEVEKLLDALCAKGIETRFRWSWRPQLNDPDDGMVLDTAINGQAHAIVTFNQTHFEMAARRFGIRTISPSRVMKEVGHP